VGETRAPEHHDFSARFNHSAGGGKSVCERFGTFEIEHASSDCKVGHDAVRNAEAAPVSLVSSKRIIDARNNPYVASLRHGHQNRALRNPKTRCVDSGTEFVNARVREAGDNEG
jgi:hypothetical protein